MPNANFVNMTNLSAYNRFMLHYSNHSLYGPVTSRIGPNDISISGYVNGNIVTQGVATPRSTVSAADILLNRSYPGWEQDYLPFN